jgi:Leucine carboxyl methyltransferase
VLPAEVQTATGRTHQVGRVAIRTLWFDTQLLAALDPARQPQPLLAELRPGASSISSNGSGSAVQLRLTANATPGQVVMLGAGMDTRAWRLQLPPGACCKTCCTAIGPCQQIASSPCQDRAMLPARQPLGQPAAAHGYK